MVLDGRHPFDAGGCHNRVVGRHGGDGKVFVLIGLLQCQFLSEFIKQVNFNSSVFGI